MEDPASEQESGSLPESARRIGQTVLETLRNRIELFALELEEEKHWFVYSLLWTAATILSGTLAVIFVTVAVVWLLPKEAQKWAVIGFCICYIVVAILTYRGLRRHLREKPSPFSGTISELKKDIEWIRPQN